MVATSNARELGKLRVVVKVLAAQRRTGRSCRLTLKNGARRIVRPARVRRHWIPASRERNSTVVRARSAEVIAPLNNLTSVQMATCTRRSEQNGGGQEAQRHGQWWNIEIKMEVEGRAGAEGRSVQETGVGNNGGQREPWQAGRAFNSLQTLKK